MISSGLASRFVISLQFYYPKAYLTGPKLVKKLETCYNSVSVNLFDKVLNGVS